eukprot:TRINITY_DN12979_c0_g1_i1.p1 TRINITY_DN12979_c0_g1~~TRINITY_DN12979_c0_g1_i1.p1  ORF type:complete len:436 (-),score=58.32 TRINITY_DN12979_c0_g1_i1:54-1361(-)
MSITLLFDKGFSRFQEEGLFQDLDLRVGDVSYPVHRLIVSNHSSVLRQLIARGHFSNTYPSPTPSITLDLKIGGAAAFPEVLDYFYSGEAPITVKNVVGMKYVARKLDIPALDVQLDHFLATQLQKNDVPLILDQAADLDLKQVLANSLKVFARHLSHFVDNGFDFRSTRLELMFALLVHEDLFVESEDVIFEVIMNYLAQYPKLEPTDDIAKTLISTLRTEKLSSKCWEEAKSSKFASLFALQEGAESTTLTASRRRQASYGRVFEFDKEFDTKGIIYWIATNRYRDRWRNPQDRGLITVTMSSLEKGKLETICDLSPKECWSQDIPSSWITFDLGLGRRLKATRYALRHGGNSKQDCLRNWVIKGSNDNVEWVTLRRHKFDESLNGPFAASSWELEMDQPTRFFQIVQTGHNSSSNNFLSLSGFEMYGDLYVG